MIRGQPWGHWVFSPFPPATSFIINEHNGQHWTGNYAGQVSKPKSLPPASFPREKTKLPGEKTKLPGEKTKLMGEKTKLTGEKTKFARRNKHGEHHGQVQVGVAAVEEPGHVPPARPRQLLHAIAEQPKARQQFYRFGVLCKIWPLFRGIYLPLPFTQFPSNVQFRAKAFRVNYVSWYTIPVTLLRLSNHWSMIPVTPLIFSNHWSMILVTFLRISNHWYTISVTLANQNSHVKNNR